VSPAQTSGTALRLAEGALAFWTPSGSRRFSREQFWKLVDGYARLIAAEPRVGGFGLIVDRTSPDMMALFIAFMVTDRRVSFFPPSSARQDAAYYLEQQREAISRIAPDSLLVFEDPGVEAIARMGAELGTNVVRLPRLSQQSETGDPAASRAAFAAALADRERLLFWQHSSGTTGIKKAVGVTSAMLRGQFDAYWPQVEALTSGEVRIASWLPLYHDMGLLAAFLLPLLGGAELAIQDPFDWIEEPALFLRMIEAERSTICWQPNFAYRHFTRLKPALPSVDLASMRAWVSCSEPCRDPDARAFEAAFAAWGVAPGSVLGCYAMAETVFAVSQLSPSERRALQVPVNLAPGVRPANLGATVRLAGDETPTPVDQQAVLSSGRIVPGLELGVFVDGVRVDADGTYGEIGLRGPFLFDRYRSLSRSESSIRDDGFFLTGDLGVMLDGHVYVFGRSKEIIIVNGKNIYAGDVEDRLGQLPGVRPGRVVAFGLDNTRTGSEDLIVVAEKRADAVDDDEALERAISAAVTAAFLVTPFDVRVVDDRWLVKSTSGKISRQSNRTKYLDQFAE
jgi:fatty-acyl-CoA synthase